MTLVKEVMRRKFDKLSPKDSTRKAVDVLIKRPESAISVFEKGKFVGEVHQRDLLQLAMDPQKVHFEQILGPSGIRNLLRRKAKTVRQIMHRFNIKIAPDADIHQALRLMFREKITLLPVQENGKVIGVLTEVDLLKIVRKKYT